MKLKMKELPILERPYEKLEIYGAEMLSNAELLAIIIKTGNKKETAVALAQKILNLNKNYNKNDLRFLQEISIEELTEVKGIGKVKAIQIKAVSEIAKSHTRGSKSFVSNSAKATVKVGLADILHCQLLRRILARRMKP